MNSKEFLLKPVEHSSPMEVSLKGVDRRRSFGAARASLFVVSCPCDDTTCRVAPCACERHADLVGESLVVIADAEDDVQSIPEVSHGRCKPRLGLHVKLAFRDADSSEPLLDIKPDAWPSWVPSRIGGSLCEMVEAVSGRSTVFESPGFVLLAMFRRPSRWLITWLGNGTVPMGLNRLGGSEGVEKESVSAKQRVQSGSVAYGTIVRNMTVRERVFFATSMDDAEEWARALRSRIADQVYFNVDGIQKDALPEIIRLLRASIAGIPNVLKPVVIGPLRHADDKVVEDLSRYGIRRTPRTFDEYTERLARLKADLDRSSGGGGFALR